MTEILTAPLLLGVRCDTPGCGDELVAPQGLRAWDLDRWFRAQREGWSWYVGRFTRHYCWLHGPRPGHKMRLVHQQPVGGE